MNEPVYKSIEVTGTSTQSIENAIQNAIKRTGQTLDCMDWFEVLQIRGNLENNSLKHYQVTLKIGFLVKDISS